MAEPLDAAGAANLTREEALARSAVIGDLAYVVELDLTAAAGQFTSSTTVTFTCSEPGRETFIDFAPAEVTALTLNGRALPLPPAGHRVQLPGLAAVNTLHLVGRCPFRNDGVGMHRFQDPVDGLEYCYTHFEPFDAHRVFACFDQPDCKGAIALSVRAPAAWTVIANSLAEAGPDPAGEARTWRFRPTPPIAPYVAAVVAGPFHSVAAEHGGVPLGLHCRQSLAPHLDADELLTVTRQGLDFFPTLFGHPYPFDRYDQVFVPEFNAGAMENAGCVTIAEGYLFRGRVTDLEREGRADTLLHEMAHMWFGDLVTLRWWEDLWLNESVATLMALLACVRATRFEGRWLDFASWTQSLGRQADQRPTTHPIVAVVPDLESVHLNFDRITYEKGCSVLRQLLAFVGEDAFAAGLQRYVARHRFGNATMADFLAALGAASGRDLTPWAAGWLETSGVTLLRAEVDGAGTGGAGGGGPGRVRLHQERGAAGGPLLPHRVALGLYDDRGGRLQLRRRVELDATTAVTEVAQLAGEPRAALLLPNDGALTYAKVRLDPHSLATALERLRDLHDPLARTLVWEVLRDMLRDGELPVRRYVALVERHGAGEEEPRVLLPLLRTLTVVVARFTAPPHAAELRRRVAGLARRSLAASPPGGDVQLAWARVWIGLADGPDDCLQLRGLLDGRRTVAGLAVDVDLRWTIVARLNATGADDGAALVAAELRQDPTDIGQRRAGAARAARPLAEEKAWAWDAVTLDRSCPVATVRAILRGFQQPDQADLLRPYVEPYLSRLEPVWRERDLEMALTFAAEGFPHHIIDPDLDLRLDVALTSGGLAPPLRRILIEGQDDCRRALRARACDAAAAAD